MGLSEELIRLREKLSIVLLELLKRDYLLAMFFQQFDRKIEEDLGFRGCCYVENGQPTIVIDKHTLQSETIDVLTGLLRHEGYHLILEHPTRALNLIDKYAEELKLNRELVAHYTNLAADVIVNQLIPENEQSDDHTYITYHLLELIPGCTLEYYTRKLLSRIPPDRMKEIIQQACGGESSEEKSENKEEDTSSDRSAESVEADDTENKDQNKDQSTKENTTTSRPEPSSTSNDRHQKIEKAAKEAITEEEAKRSYADSKPGTTSGNMISRLDPENPVALSVESLISNAVSRTRSAGKSIHKYVEEKHSNINPGKPKTIDLISYIRRYGTSSVRFNKRKPSKRYRIPPRPEFRTESISVVVAIDTSYSVWSTPWLSRFFETAIEMHRKGVQIYLIECDTEIKYAGYLTDEAIGSMEGRGGGGTYFAPVFNHVNETLPSAKLVMYFTDGMNFDTENTYRAVSQLDHCKIVWVISERGTRPTCNGKDLPGDHLIAGKDFPAD